MKKPNVLPAQILLLIIFGTIVGSLLVGAFIIAPALDIKRCDGAAMGVVTLIAAVFITGLAIRDNGQQEQRAESPETETSTASSEDELNAKDDHEQRKVN